MRLGEYIRGTKVDCQGTLCNSDGVQNIEVGKVKPHPGYKPAPNWMNDICLLGLKLPARITSMSCTFLYSMSFTSWSIYNLYFFILTNT